MSSADKFLRLLEEKDLVSPETLRAARRMAATSDAVRISLWLVQNQHLTASQAERLLTAASEQSPLRPPPPPPEKAPEPKPAPPSRPAAANDDLELAPEEPAGSSGRPGAKPVAPPAGSPDAPKQPPADGAASQAKIGGELESLETSMKGPLDSLIESEALAANPFDDPMAAPDLGPAAPKKFKLRRFLKNLFTRRNKSKVVKIKAADPRQVKLLVISWGIAVLLFIGILTTLWMFMPGDTAEMLRNAEVALAKEDYEAAIKQYDQFLANYPKIEGADEVRRLKCLAELGRANQQAAASGDWAAAVETAKTQVKALPKDLGSGDTVQKFAILLARTGEAVAKRAQAGLDPVAVDQLQTIVNLLDNDIPAAVRPAQMLDGIRRVLRRSRQDVERARDLDQTVKMIVGAVSEDDLKGAYAEYGRLVDLYPELVDDARLIDAMRQVAAAQQKAVKLVRKTLPAETGDRPSALAAAMPLAVRPVAGKLPLSGNRFLFVVEQGTVFGLNAADGKVLWRRFVAREPKQAPVTALRLDDPAGGDAVVCDPHRHELLRLKGATGEPVWRLPIGGPIAAPPVTTGKWLLLLTRDHRLLFIDPVKGDSPQALQLPQVAGVPPVVDAERGLVFVVGEHSNLYVISQDDCRQAFHLGHQAGAIAAPPSVCGGLLLVAVNAVSRQAPSEAVIHVLAIGAKKDEEPLRLVQRIKVKGHVDTAAVPVTDGAIVATAQGGIIALQRNAAGAAEPFRAVARLEPALDERSTHYAVADGGMFWIAGKQLTRYAVRADEGRIVPQAACEQGVQFVQPPAIEAGAMFRVTRRPGLPGLTVSAVDPTANEPVWQTWLGAPLVDAPMPGAASGKLTAVTVSGGLFRVSPDAVKAGAAPVDAALSVDTSLLTRPLATIAALPGEGFAMTCGADTKQIAVFDPKEANRFRWLSSPREMAAAPAAFAEGLLTACVNGQVFLLDPQARRDALAEPFEPPLQNVRTWEWRAPEPAGAKLAVLCDGDRRLYAVGLTAGDKPALRRTVTDEVMTKNALVSPVAVLGQSVFVADSSDTVLSFLLPGLSAGKPVPLKSRRVWGPRRVGKYVLVAAETGNNAWRLFAIDEQQQVAWQSDFSHGPLAGAPCLSGDDIYLASTGGIVWRISAAGGKELGRVDAGCPLGTGPIVVVGRLLIGGHDGSLLEVKKP